MNTRKIIRLAADLEETFDQLGMIERLEKQREILGEALAGVVDELVAESKSYYWP